MNEKNRNLRKVKVFISSPGDVADARQRAREAVENVNRLFAIQNGIFFHVRGWEDISTGKAERTQDLINPDLEDTDIYIGIFNKRFGTPTGNWESGTEEEYELMYRRWKEEDPKPIIKMYFRRLSEEEVTDPGLELTKILEFKAKIKPTDLYYEFDSVEELGQRIFYEFSLLINNEEWLQSIQSKPEIRTVPNLKVPILSKLIESSSVTLQEIVEEFGPEATDIAQNLRERGFLNIVRERLHPSYAINSFLSVSKQLFDSGQHLKLLQSDYYQEILKSVLADIVLERFHCHLNKDQVKVFRTLATLSPAAADYILFGDTELYDTLVEHGRRIKKENFAQDMLFRNFIHRVLLRYGEDHVNGRILDTVEGVNIEAQVYTVRLVAAHAAGMAFKAESGMPLVRAKAAEDINKGQIASGKADNFVHAGTLMMYMEENEMAIQQLDMALAQKDVPTDVRYAALNNKGLVLMKLGKPIEAAALFEEALQLDPDRPEARKNLELAHREIDSADGSNS